MSPLRGILFKLGSVVLFIFMASAIKATSDHVPPGQAVFFRSAFAMPVIVVWLVWTHNLRDGIRTVSPMTHIWRGLVGTTAMGCLFAGLAFLPLPEVTAIGYAAPLLVVIFAAMFLGEKVGVFRLSAVALGMCGVLIVVAPRLSVGSEGVLNATEAFGAMLVLFGAVCAALAQVFIRKMVATETTSAIVFWFSFTSTCVALMTIPFGWVMPSPWEATLLVSAGLMGGVGQILLTSAYRHADASVVAPFDYASMLFALLIGYVFFAEVPTWTMLGGAALVVLAGVIIILRERHLGLKREQQRRVTTPQG
jgi:drug/metabolite transporter (DMT)-like permease